MADGDFHFLEPLIIAPLVSADTLTAGVVAEVPINATELRMRIYERDTTPPAWAVRDYGAPLPFTYEYVTWHGLEVGKVYVLEAELDGSHTASAELVWPAPHQVFPAPDQTFAVEPRPWSWEPIAAQWMDQLPWYWREDPTSLELFRRLGAEFQRIYAAIEQLQRWVTPSRAYDYGLRIHEASLGIDPPDTLPEARRRALVMAHLRGRVDPSASTFLNSLRLILGEQAPDVREIFDQYRVIIDTQGSAEIQSLVQEVVERILPAHLEVEFGSLDFLLDYDERRAPLGTMLAKGRASSRTDPNEPRSAGFDFGELD